MNNPDMIHTHGPGCDGLATIRYRLGDGIEREWTIGAAPCRDNEATLRAHLARWLPAAEFLGFVIGRATTEPSPEDKP